MSGFLHPCLPVLSKFAPRGSEWVHEIKYDGYRLIVRRHRDDVWLYTRNGHDWSGRYARIIEAAKMLPTRGSFMLNGEVVICDRRGHSDFEALHSGKQNHQAVLFAFGLLELNGSDICRLPLVERKSRLADLLTYVRDGIRLSEHLEGDGRMIFQHACRMGLEGIVSKRIDLSYRSGPFISPRASSRGVLGSTIGI
jgi:bifunctional non-homologous end joining protein LigD